MDFRFLTPDEIKQQRVNIDKCIKDLEPFVWREGLDDPGDSNCYLARVEVVEALSSLRNAKLWLQEALTRIGQHLPDEYRDEYKPTQEEVKELLTVKEDKQLDLIDAIKNKGGINFKKTYDKN